MFYDNEAIEMHWANFAQCEHEYEHGICRYCFCPETPKDTDRALASMYDYKEATR